MADPIGWIAEGKPAENEAFMVFGKRTEYACVPVCIAPSGRIEIRGNLVMTAEAAAEWDRMEAERRGNG